MKGDGSEREKLLEATAHNYGVSFREEMLKFIDDIQSMPKDDCFLALMNMAVCCFKDGWRSADANTLLDITYALNPNKIKS